MVTITNTVNLCSEKGIEGIITLNRSINSDYGRREFVVVLRRTLSKLYVVLHRKDIPGGHFNCWQNRLKLVLNVPVNKDKLKK